MKTKTVERLLKEMENDPWHDKLRHWWRVWVRVRICRTRWIWDLDYQHNIFRKRNGND